ncbi:MAG: tRNA wybutosine-synthesizing 3 family protein [Nanobdellota archaeon]
MSFEEKKRNALDGLEKEDRSRKGKVDEDIRPLLDILNNHPDYYTTSSCSGRIMLYTSSENKKDCRWLFVSHGFVKREDLPRIEGEKEPVWLKQESMILHIIAKDLPAAEKLVKTAKDAGIKRPGIQSIKPRIMTEIMYGLKVDVPVHDEKMLVSEEYLDYIINIANENQKKNKEKIKKLKASFSTL